MNDRQLSEAIEALLVAANPRQMQRARSALQSGYYLRAAEFLRDCSGVVIIGTGFPVGQTFETDGPVGAIALYTSLQSLGARPVLACEPPLSTCLQDDYEVLELPVLDANKAGPEAQRQLQRLQPHAVISIERPGLAADGGYYNMRGEDIGSRCARFDPFLELATCPTIAIGDGGNEIGMGNIAATISTLQIRGSVTRCDELLVADVSNWGAYGLITFLARWAGRDILGELSPLEILQYLSERGSVDGVTRTNTLTEDGLDASRGMEVLRQLRCLSGFAK